MSLMKSFHLILFILVISACTINPVSTLPSIQSSSVHTPILPTDIAIQSRNNYYPFDLIIDTIAFMNCPGQIHSTNYNFFSFKFASYKQGIHLNKQFLNSIEPYTAQNIKTAIKSSQYVNTRAQISLSPKGNPLNYMSLSEDQNSGLALFNPPFSDTEFINTITTQYQVTKVAGVPFKANFPIAAYQLTSANMALGNDRVFTLTYNKNQSGYSPISLSPGVFYGRTYSTLLGGGVSSTNHLKQVNEINLSNGKTSGSWTCSPKLRFQIHRHPRYTQLIYQRNTRYFAQENLNREAECRSSGSYPNKNLLDQVLNKNAFTVGNTYIWGNNQWNKTKKLCIVPKDIQQSCYAGGNSTLRIEFQNESDCNPLDSEKRCPSYLSICERR